MDGLTAVENWFPYGAMKGDVFNIDGCPWMVKENTPNPCACYGPCSCKKTRGEDTNELGLPTEIWLSAFVPFVAAKRRLDNFEAVLPAAVGQPLFMPAHDPAAPVVGQAGQSVIHNDPAAGDPQVGWIMTLGSGNSWVAEGATGIGCIWATLQCCCGGGEGGVATPPDPAVELTAEDVGAEDPGNPTEDEILAAAGNPAPGTIICEIRTNGDKYCWRVEAAGGLASTGVDETGCCAKAPIEIPPDAFEDPGNPTDAEINDWIAANGNSVINQLYYVTGDGTANNPGHTYSGNGDGTGTNIDSPTCCPEPPVKVDQQAVDDADGDVNAAVAAAANGKKDGTKIYGVTNCSIIDGCATGGAFVGNITPLPRNSVVLSTFNRGFESYPAPAVSDVDTAVCLEFDNGSGCTYLVSAIGHWGGEGFQFILPAAGHDMQIASQQQMALNGGPFINRSEFNGKRENNVAGNQGLRGVNHSGSSLAWPAVSVPDGGKLELCVRKSIISAKQTSAIIWNPTLNNIWIIAVPVY